MAHVCHSFRNWTLGCAISQTIGLWLYADGSLNRVGSQESFRIQTPIRTINLVKSTFS